MCTPWNFVSGMRPAREQSVPGRLLYTHLTLFPSPSIDSHIICNRLHFVFPGEKTAPCSGKRLYRLHLHDRWVDRSHVRDTCVVARTHGIAQTRTARTNQT